MYKTKFETLLEFLFPRMCLQCGRPGVGVCIPCSRKYLPEFPLQQCHICGVPSRIGLAHVDCQKFSSLDGVLIASAYSELAKHIMSRVKFHSESEFISDMSRIMWERCKSQLENLPIETITYVPATAGKVRERGFNQAEQIARKIGRYLNLEPRKLLARSAQTKTQIGMGVLDRAMNVRSQFQPLPDTNFKTVLIIDDVMTTGATLEACASALKCGGVEQAYGLVFARNPEFAIANML